MSINIRKITVLSGLEGENIVNLMTAGLLTLHGHKFTESLGIVKNQTCTVMQPNTKTIYHGVVCKQSTTGGDDITLSKQAVDHFSNASQTAYFIMIDISGVVVETISAKDLAQQMKGKKPRVSQKDGSEYWWHPKPRVNNVVGIKS